MIEVGVPPANHTSNANASQAPNEVAVGTQATPEVMLFQITDLSRVWASATLSAESAPSIASGTKGRFLTRRGERSYDVEATLVEPRVSSETRTTRVRFTAKNSDASYARWPGCSAAG